MKLYDVPRNSVIKIGEKELYFFHVDGMYSFCKDKYGQILHPSAMTDIISYDNTVSYEEFINKEAN